MKKMIRILALTTLILSIIVISDTYAKFLSQASGSGNFKIGKWEITLNSTDIYSSVGQVVEFPINSTNVIIENQNTVEGKVSPESTWYTDIVLNPEGTDVAVRYDIEIDTSHIQDIDIEYEALNADTQTELTRTSQNTYTGIINLSDIQEGKKANIRCSITWKSGENTNTADSALGSVYGGTFEIPVKVTCIQYSGETITEYTD